MDKSMQNAAGHLNIDGMNTHQAEQVNIVWYNGEIISVTGNPNRVEQIKALIKFAEYEPLSEEFYSRNQILDIMNVTERQATFTLGWLHEQLQKEKQRLKNIWKKDKK